MDTSKEFTVKFVGGPWAGETRAHISKTGNAPVGWACPKAAKAVGMYGLYGRKSIEGSIVTMTWRGVQKK